MYGNLVDFQETKNKIYSKKLSGLFNINFLKAKKAEEQKAESETAEDKAEQMIKVCGIHMNIKEVKQLVHSKGIDQANKEQGKETV